MYEELLQRQQSWIANMSLPPVNSPAYSALLSSCKNNNQSYLNLEKFSPFIEDHIAAENEHQQIMMRKRKVLDEVMGEIGVWSSIQKCARRLTRCAERLDELTRRDVWEISGARRVNRITSDMRNNAERKEAGVVLPFSTFTDEAGRNVLDQLRYLQFLKDSIGNSANLIERHVKFARGVDLDTIRNSEFAEVENDIPEYIVELAKMKEKHDLDLFDTLYFKPYLRKDLRDKAIREIMGQSRLALSLLRVGDVLHLPFSRQEFAIVLDFVKNARNIIHEFKDLIRSISESLPGRTFTDVANFFYDHLPELRNDLHEKFKNALLLRLNRALLNPGQEIHISSQTYEETDSESVSGKSNKGNIAVRNVSQFGSRLKNLSKNVKFSLGSYVISSLFSPERSRKFDCLIASTAENQSFVSIYNSLDESMKQITYESKYLHDAIYSLYGNNVYIVNPDEEIQIVTHDLEMLWDFKGYNVRNAQVENEDRKNISLRLHQVHPDLFFAFKDRENNAPIWCVNNSSKLASKLECSRVHDVQATSDDLVISSSSGLHIYSLNSLALRQAPKLERDKHPNLIRVPSKSSWSTGNLANLFGYSSSFQNDIGDSFIDFMDIRTADSTGISINYKKSHTRSPAWITDFSFSPDGNFIQSSGADNRIFVHDIRHNSQILAIFEHDSSTITSEDVPEGEFPWDGVATEWSSDSQYLVSTADDCSIRIWDIYRSEKQSISTIRFDVSEGRPQTLSLSSDHDSISIGTSRGIFSLYSIP